MIGDAQRMDAIYARQQHFYDLTRKYYLLGRDRPIAGLDLAEGGSVIEIGCGTARNLIAIAKAWPAARLFGIDLSEAMLTTARANVARAGLSDRIMLAQGDATDFDACALFGEIWFDRVVLSYTLSMIPDWRAAMLQAAGAYGARGSGGDRRFRAAGAVARCVPAGIVRVARPVRRNAARGLAGGFAGGGDTGAADGELYTVASGICLAWAAGAELMCRLTGWERLGCKQLPTRLVQVGSAKNRHPGPDLPLSPSDEDASPANAGVQLRGWQL